MTPIELTPEAPPADGWAAVYRLYGAAGELLYIGSTGNVQARWWHHKCRKAWWPTVAAFTLEWHPSRVDAYAAEAVAIAAERPAINVYGIPHQRPEVEIAEHERRVAESLDAIEAIDDRGERIRAKSRVMAAQIKRNKDWAQERRDYVFELRDAQMSFRKIAEEVGTSLAVVQGILADYKGSGSHRPRKDKPAAE